MNRFFLFLLLTLINGIVHAQISVVGNGGDGLAIEFHNLARGISQNLMVAKYRPGFNISVFSYLAQNAKIETQERLFLMGREVDAINYPTLKKIVLSRSRWVLTSRSIPASISLVFHEILGLMNIQNDNLVKQYTDLYIHNFVNTLGDNRPHLVLNCVKSISTQEMALRFKDASGSGYKNFLIYKQNSDYLIYYQDNLLPLSLRPYDTVNHFLGYFKCHMNPDRTSVFCAEPPCSRIIFEWKVDQQLFLVRTRVDRITPNCEVPKNQLVPTMVNYFVGNMAFAPSQCQRY